MVLDLPQLRAPGATVVAVGAHADDIEIASGGTLLRLREQYPTVRLEWVVCSAGGVRDDEARAAATAFGADACTLLDFNDRYLPADWLRLKQAIGEVAGGLARCDLVLAPARHDRHQDHRTVADLVWQTFRETVIWAYEIVKFEGDLGQPNLFVPLSRELLDHKVDLLERHFPSQAGRGWFDAETFRGLARIRGVQGGARWAEAFHVEKMVW